MKPGIRELLIASATDAALRRRLYDAPDEVFEAYALSDEEKDILRTRDVRLLALLGAAVSEQSPPAPALDQPEPAPEQESPVTGRQLPDMQLALTVVPILLEAEGQSRGLTFAAWVNPLPEGVDPEALPAPPGTQLPGRALTPLHAVVHVSAQQLPDAGDLPQVGMTARLLRATNMTGPPIASALVQARDAESAAAPDIYIVGLGILTAGQITREVEQAIRASNEVLYLDTGAATGAVLKELSPRVTSLYEEAYLEGRSRVRGYEGIAERVIEAARDHAPVVFAIHGHPLVAATPPFQVMERARELGLRVQVLPGISAIDTVFADLRIDPVVHGIQMYEATDLLLRRRPLQPDVPALIWQIGPLETCLHSLRVSSAERFERFVGHLRLFYPARHEVTAIYCSPHALMDPTVLTFPLEEMGRHAREIHTGFSLYVPPVGSRAIEDFDLLGKLTSTEHLKKITGG